MQNNFSGIGVYIDPDIYHSMNETTREQYIIKSAFCIYDKDESYTRYESYYDLKYNNVTPFLMKFLLMNYIKTIALNKKASRYYLSAILSCLNQVTYYELINEYLDLFLNENLLTINKTIFYDLLPIHLMLINRLYDSFGEISSNKHANPNYSMCEELDRLMEKSALIEGFDNLQLYSDKLLSKKNKYLFTTYVSMKVVENISDTEISFSQKEKK